MRIYKDYEDGERLIENKESYFKKEVLVTEVLWRCCLQDCQAYGTTQLDYKNDNSTFTLKLEHNHYNEKIEKKRRDWIENLKKRTLISHENIEEIVDRFFLGASYEKIKILGELTSLYETLENYRDEHANPKPYANQSLGLSMKLLITHTKDKFYRYGPENYQNLTENDDFIIFFSDDALERINKSDILSIDGRFKYLPESYNQLLIISYIRENIIFPSIFCLLKNKEVSTYIEVFKTIKNLGFDCKPKAIKPQFDNNLISVLSDVFPNSKISGCFFDLGQMIYNRVGKLGLISKYINNRLIKKYIKALSALTFVEPKHLKETFEQIKNTPEFPSKDLNELYSHFYSDFIEKIDNTDLSSGNYSLDFWNYSFDTSVPRTNNAIKGWYKSFYETFYDRDITFPFYVERLKHIEDWIRITAIRLKNGDRDRNNKKYFKIETKLADYFKKNPSHFYGSDYVFDITGILFDLSD